MSTRESLEQRRSRFLQGPRLGALRELFDEIRQTSLDDDRAYALSMLIVDAILDGDEAALHHSTRQLQILHRHAPQPDKGNAALGEDARGRILSLMDVAHWGLERTLSWNVLAELEYDSNAHSFLKHISEQPGMSNGELASALGVSEAEASRLGRRLADASLAAKRRLGRRNHWEITPKGMMTLDLLESGGALRYLRPHYQLQ